MCKQVNWRLFGFLSVAFTIPFPLFFSPFSFLPLCFLPSFILFLLYCLSFLLPPCFIRSCLLSLSPHTHTYTHTHTHTHTHTKWVPRDLLLIYDLLEDLACKIAIQKIQLHSKLDLSFCHSLPLSDCFSVFRTFLLPQIMKSFRPTNLEQKRSDNSINATSQKVFTFLKWYNGHGNHHMCYFSITSSQIITNLAA